MSVTTALAPLLAITQANISLAFAQTPAPNSASGDAFRLSAAVRANLNDATSVTLGGLYLNDLNTSVPFVLVDYRLNENWTLHGGYLIAAREIDGASRRTTQFIRFGVIYRQTQNAITFENRLAHEIVIDDQRHMTGGRVRDRMRLSYALDMSAREPRLLGYIEPIVEYGLGRSSRVDVAFGAGATPLRGIRVDVYAMHQAYTRLPQNSVDALVVEVVVQATD